MFYYILLSPFNEVWCLCPWAAMFWCVGGACEHMWVIVMHIKAWVLGYSWHLYICSCDYWWWAWLHPTSHQLLFYCAFAIIHLLACGFTLIHMRSKYSSDPLLILIYSIFHKHLPCSYHSNAYFSIHIHLLQHFLCEFWCLRWRIT